MRVRMLTLHQYFLNLLWMTPIIDLWISLFLCLYFMYEQDISSVVPGKWSSGPCQAVVSHTLVRNTIQQLLWKKRQYLELNSIMYVSSMLNGALVVSTATTACTRRASKNSGIWSTRQGMTYGTPFYSTHSTRLWPIGKRIPLTFMYGFLLELLVCLLPGSQIKRSEASSAYWCDRSRNSGSRSAAFGRVHTRRKSKLTCECSARKHAHNRMSCPEFAVSTSCFRSFHLRGSITL